MSSNMGTASHLPLTQWEPALVNCDLSTLGMGR